MATWKTNRDTRRAERKAAYPHEDEPEVVVAEKAPEPEPAPLTPSPEPPVLPEWQPTVAAAVEEKDKTVGDWIVQGVRAICDEHKLTSLKAWRDVAGNVQVEYVEDSRAMYALRKK